MSVFPSPRRERMKVRDQIQRAISPRAIQDSVSLADRRSRMEAAVAIKRKQCNVVPSPVRGGRVRVGDRLRRRCPARRNNSAHALAPKIHQHGRTAAREMPSNRERSQSSSPPPAGRGGRRGAKFSAQSVRARFRILCLFAIAVVVGSAIVITREQCNVRERLTPQLQTSRTHPPPQQSQRPRARRSSGITAKFLRKTSHAKITLPAGYVGSANVLKVN
jgi:hypothetical protein